MDFVNQPPLHKGTPARPALSPDQPLTVQEFLRSLKKPTRPFPLSEGLETLQERTPQSGQLTVQAFLHGLRKPVSPLHKPAEAAESPRIQIIAWKNLDNSQSIAAASSPSFLDPPEATPNKIGSEIILSLSPEGKGPQCPTPKGKEKEDVSMKIPKVTRTYTKKAKQVSLPQRGSPALFLTQSPTHKEPLIDGLHDDRSDSPAQRLASKEASRTRPARKHTSEVLQKRKRSPLQENEENRRVDHDEDDADMVTGEKKGKKRRRRAPVNELALMKVQVRLSSGQHFIWILTRQSAQSTANFVGQKAYDSDNAIDLLNEHLDEQRSSAYTSPRCERNREPAKANVGKPVTRIRHEMTVPKREVLTQEGFRFPPVTPRANAKPPGWKLGSGFEGVTLDLSTKQRPKISRNRKARHARTPSFLGRSLSELELSTRSSPIRQSISQRGILKKQKDRDRPVETRDHEPAMDLGTADRTVKVDLPGRSARTGGKVAFEQTTSFTAPIQPTIENDQFQTAPASQIGNVKEPNQLHLNQATISVASQEIRRPSKSERNGWLKRKNFDSAVADQDNEEISEFEDEILDRQSLNSAPQPPPSPDFNEAAIPTSPLHVPGPSIPNSRHHVDVPRTSEIPETQDRLQEFVELDHTRTESQSLSLRSYPIPVTSLDSGDYFSKAVQQLDSPEVPHTVTQRRSRRDVSGSQVMFRMQTGAHHVSVALITGQGRFEEQEGSLELGVTPRLKESMSNVPFRPPFKEPL